LKVLQINTIVNSGSTGRIAEDIGNVLIENGHSSYIAFGRGNRPSNSKLIKIGNELDVYNHGLKTLLTDKHGFGSKRATLELIKQIEQINPDVIGLHNLHGYYVNIELLFKFLSKSYIPVLWTLFDCWAFTGHCTYFDDISCEKWKIQCDKCPKHKNYPKSLVDNSFDNFNKKRELFNSLHRLELVTHSNWLKGLVEKSFLSDLKIHHTPSAINLELFKHEKSDLKAKYNLENKKVVLGCASIWSNRKGLNDFLQLYKLLDENYQIVLIGLNSKEIKLLPKEIIGISRTENTKELAQWYSLAEVFVNPTTQDNFPTTNLEALACGTPVITYNTGGSPESIDHGTGIVVEKGDITGLSSAIKYFAKLDRQRLVEVCRNRAKNNYDKNSRYLDYLNIFENLIK
jgi:glycosyltransferase involved in cell wall biosynthesis